MVRLLKKLLPRAGATTSWRPWTVKEAIELYQQHKAEIDVVLLDLGLPKVTGLDVIPRLKSLNPAVRIIIATGYLQPELKAEILRAGRDGLHPQTIL
jgi:CheY-like chemotaxis protein